MFDRLHKFDPIVHLTLLIGIIILFSLVFFGRQQLREINLRLAKRDSGTAIEAGEEGFSEIDINDSTDVDVDYVRKVVSDIIATLSATPKTIIKREVVTTTSGKTSYIPLGTTATTTSTDWEDVQDAQVYIDLEKDFGKNSEVSWEAFLKVAHGNGQSFARLYDDTNKIVVLGSEISTTNNSDFKQVSSGNLNLWSGRNLYKVQIKSLNSFKVTYSGGRIKISNSR